MIENLRSLDVRAASEGMFAMIEPGRHHDYILAIRVGGPEDVAQIVQISGIADGNQNVSRPHPERSRSEFLVSVDSELIQILGLAVPLFGDPMFGVGKNGKENRAECNSRDCALGFGARMPH